jgi:hypothetical protein
VAASQVVVIYLKDILFYIDHLVCELFALIIYFTMTSLSGNFGSLGYLVQENFLAHLGPINERVMVLQKTLIESFNASQDFCSGELE